MSFAYTFVWTSAAKEAFLTLVQRVRKMDEDERDLVQRLFATATALIETAHEEAASGQSADLTAEEYLAAAERLQLAAGEAATLADAITIIAKRSINREQDSGPS